MSVDWKVRLEKDLNDINCEIIEYESERIHLYNRLYKIQNKLCDLNKKKLNLMKMISENEGEEIK